MSKVDGRKIPHAVRESIRMEAMLQWQDGASASHLAEIYGINKSCIYEWINSYKQGGFDALKTGEMPGRPPKLTDSQKAELEEILLHQNPTAYGFYKSLWTRDIVAAVIRRVFDVSMHPASVGRMLRKMGFSPQRPTRKAWQQSKKKVHEWLNETYPALRTQAEAHNALIYFADEASVRSDYHSGTTWGRKGCTPVVEATGARFGINMISAISGEGTMRYMTIPGRFNADVFIRFLKQMVRSHDRPVMVVVDGHSAHKAKKVLKYLRQEPRLLAIEILPAYSPELNPDELVWGYLKSGHIGRMLLRSKEQFLRAITSGLRSLQKMPDRIKGFFRAEHTAYACVEVFVG